MKGICYLVGAGPGNLGLVTLRAKELVERADVIVNDHLANPQILGWAKEDAEVIYVGKVADCHTVPQEGINELLVRKVDEGKCVVRLKGGDPYLFGRGGEEAQELARAGCHFEVVPGITSAMAAAAYAGIPLTHRDFVSSVTFITGHENPDKAQSCLEWKGLVDGGGTLAVYMGMRRIEEIMNHLMEAGLNCDMPAAVVQWGTTGRQRSIFGTVGNLAAKVKVEGIASPAIIFVGRVVELSTQLGWFEKLPLMGKRVVVTRTRKQASRLRSLLAEAGAEVLELPMIRVEDTNEPLPDGYFETQEGWIFFTSPNGVDAFFRALFRKGDARTLAGWKVAAVGPTTESALMGYGIRADFRPEVFTATGMAAEWSGESGGEIFFACGDLAGEELADGLRCKGFRVTRWVGYRTTEETKDPAGVCEEIESNGADWVVFASSSAVENYHRRGINIRGEIPKYASMGPQTSEKLRELGYEVMVEAQKPRVEDLVSAIVDWEHKNYE